MAGFTFVPLPSRVGLRFPPIGSTEHNIGVEDGAFDLCHIAHPAFSPKSIGPWNSLLPPEELSADQYLKDLSHMYFSLQNEVESLWKKDTQLVTFGGDHSVSAVSLGAVLRKVPSQDVCVVMFDSHADLHQPSSSPTGNFHGMWLRPFFDTFEDIFVRSLAPAQLTANQLAYVGNLQMEQAERDWLRQNNVWLSLNGMSPIDLYQHVRQFSHIHLSFDLDIFAEVFVSATGTPNPQGLSPADVWPFLQVIRDSHRTISFDLVEFNPKKPGASRTLLLAQEVLRKALQ